MFSKRIKKFSHQVKIEKNLTQLLINGKFVNSKSGRTFDTINPSTESITARIQEGDSEDINEAVISAKTALDKGPWSRMSSTQRGKLLFKLADLMEKNRDELARLESLDNGKPFKMSIFDVEMSIEVFRYIAGWADKNTGKTIPLPNNQFCFTLNEPVGVVGAILPWNFPILMASWKIAPCLSMGNTIVIKPAEQTPLTSLKLGQLSLEAGIPEGVINVIPGFGPTAGMGLAQHPLVDKIAFTGSTEVGLKIMRESHINRLKRITLELGGKSPLIIFEDANLENALQQAVLALYLNNGQSCIAGSRTFVHESIYDAFQEKVTKYAARQKIGDPFSNDTDQGPLVDRNQVDKYCHYIRAGKSEGAKLLTGGNLTQINGKGFFAEPTVFADVQDQMTIAKEEIFGPVMSLLKFKSTDEIVERANNTEYGLAAGIVTQDINRAIRVAKAIRAGTVFINQYYTNCMSTPFGGFKNSGIGRELGQEGLHQYTEHKTVIVGNLH